MSIKKKAIILMRVNICKVCIRKDTRSSYQRGKGKRLHVLDF